LNDQKGQFESRDELTPLGKTMGRAEEGHNSFLDWYIGWGGIGWRDFLYDAALAANPNGK